MKVQPSFDRELLEEGRRWVEVYAFNTGWAVWRAVSPAAWSVAERWFFDDTAHPSFWNQGREGCLFLLVDSGSLPRTAFGFRVDLEGPDPFDPEKRAHQILWPFSSGSPPSEKAYLEAFLDWMIRPRIPLSRFGDPIYDTSLAPFDEPVNGQSPFDLEVYFLLDADSPLLLPDLEFAEWVSAQEGDRGAP